MTYADKIKKLKEEKALKEKTIKERKEYEELNEEMNPTISGKLKKGLKAFHNMVTK